MGDVSGLNCHIQNPEDLYFFVFNARYTGFGSYVIGKFFGRWDTVYTYEKFREEVRYMSRLKRNSFDLRSQYIFGIQRDYEGFNLMWGDIDGYYAVRCIKED